MQGTRAYLKKDGALSPVVSNFIAGNGGVVNPENITMRSTEETAGAISFNFNRNNITDLPPDGGIFNDVIISADNFMYVVTVVGSSLTATLLREVGKLPSADKNTFMQIPDYEKMETINRITVNNGSWTVDRDGFVYASISSNAANDWSRITINGKAVMSKSTPAGVGMTDNIYAVKVGDVVQLSAQSNRAASWTTPPGGTSPVWSGCYFIPPRIVWATTPATEFSTRLIGQPDYANQETENRISTSGGTWTTDRDGYVWWQIYSSEIAGMARADIDGKTVARIPIGRSGLPHGSVLQISKGQTIQIWASNGAVWSASSGCFFIPPKTVAPMFITGADLQQGTQNGEITWDTNTKVMRVIGGTGGGGGDEWEFIAL